MRKMILSTLIGSIMTAGFAAQAMSVEWKGNYRIEWVEIDKTSLDSPNLRKSYLLNSLQLSPKIIAADGVNIIGKFNVLHNPNYPNSQLGQIWGPGQTQSVGGSSTLDDSNVGSHTAPQMPIYVSQLYLNVNQEYGALLAGRAPLDFGLGITHSAGNGLWDHWQTTRDLVGYKFVIGNFFMMPIIGKAYSDSASQSPAATDVIYHLEYNNTETRSMIGVFHMTRSASDSANDLPAGVIGGAGATRVGGYNAQHVNVIFGRGWDAFDFKIEGGFNSGNTGVQTAAGETVNQNGYGIAAELNFPRPQSKWDMGLKMGIASGDNPTTANFEGFSFNRNYDLAMLMFNHPMGRYDLFTTGKTRPPSQCGTAPCGPYATDQALDDEAVSNVVYVSPRFDYRMNDRWTWKNSVTWARLQANPNPVEDIGMDVGFEWDTGFIYRPHEKIQWINEVGLLFPGSAFENGSAKFGKSFTYGFSSKAAISF